MAPIQVTENVVGYGLPSKMVWMRIFKSNLSLIPVKDDAGRSVIAWEGTVDVDGYILAGSGANDTTDAQWGTIRQVLRQSGGHLFYESQGASTFKINAPGGQPDMRFGPFVELLRFEPVGASRASRITWTCKFTIAECSRLLKAKGIMAYNYSSSISQNDYGQMTRSVRGYVEIAMNRVAGQPTLLDNVDRVKESVLPPPMLGFRRTRNDWMPTADKRRADFAVTDEMMRPGTGALPNGVPRGEFREHLRNKQPLVGIQFDITLSATIWMDPSLPKDRAYGIFLNFAFDRLNRLRGGQQAGNNSVNNFIQVARQGNAPETMVMVTSFEVDDETTGWSTRFSLSAWVLTPRRVLDILSLSQFWKPLPGASFAGFIASVKNGAYHPRGVNRWRERPSDDAIIDICTGTPPTVPTSSTETKPIDPPKSPPIPKSDLGAVGNRRSQVAPEVSWLHYECSIALFEDSPRLARHKPMSTREPVDLGGNLMDAGDTSAKDAGRRIGLAPSDQQPQTADVIHEVQSPSVRVVLSGRALRLGHRIPMPTLVSVGGQTASLNRVLLWHEGTNRYVEDVIHGARWSLEFLLDAPPESALPIPANPVLGIDGSD